MRLSQGMDLSFSVMHCEINRAISSAINDIAILEIQNIMNSLSSGPRNIETEMRGFDQGSNELTNGLETKMTKKDSRSAFDLRDT